MISCSALVARQRTLAAGRASGRRLMVVGCADVTTKICSDVAASVSLGRGRTSPYLGACFHTIPSLFSGRSDDDEDTQRRNRLRQDKKIPRIELFSSRARFETIGGPWAQQQQHEHQQKRGVTTTTTTTTTSASTLSPSSLITPGKGIGSMQVHSASLSSSSSSPEDDNNQHGDDHHHHRKSLRELYEEHTARLRFKAGKMRDDARESWGEFKEHPRESMKSGATSFGEMMGKYGPIFVGVHISVYFATLGALFVGIDAGALDPVGIMTMLGHGTSDHASETKNTVQFVAEWMRNHTWTESWAPYVEKNPHMANLAVAWIIVKFTEPLRLPVSVFFTPRVARYLGRGGEPPKENSPATTGDAKTEESNGKSTSDTTTTLKQ